MSVPCLYALHWYGVLATFFIIAGSVTLLNMLIGVLCEAKNHKYTIQIQQNAAQHAMAKHRATTGQYQTLYRALFSTNIG